MAYIPVTHKFVAVLNKKIPAGQVMNALAHATAGLAGSYPVPAEMRLDDYTDKDGNAHANISDNPFIILQADNSNQLRTLRNNLVEQSVYFTDFTSTMTVGTYAEQQERTAATPEIELEYWAVVMFGEIDKLNALTKKFSLLKG
ncbi:MAG TPA: DUF2000 domain-containing protein [Candidatus Saccharimonadales bacterium]|nr:DUF2000 domain-containing protein [Candidatus Saccharimonadales bacterium]